MVTNEFQYKYPVEKREDFVKKLASENINMTEPITHIYTYYKAPVTDNSKFIVLRVKETEGKKAVDAKVRNNETGKWERFESKIEDSDAMRKILKSLGCKEIFTFHKNRQSCVKDFIRLDLDTTKELGTFLEAKFPEKDKDKAKQFLNNLGIDSNSYDKRSVIEIFLEKQKS